MHSFLRCKHVYTNTAFCLNAYFFCLKHFSIWDLYVISFQWRKSNFFSVFISFFSFFVCFLFLWLEIEFLIGIWCPLSYEAPILGYKNLALISLKKTNTAILASYNCDVVRLFTVNDRFEVSYLCCKKNLNIRRKFEFF